MVAVFALGICEAVRLLARLLIAVWPAPVAVLLSGSGRHTAAKAGKRREIVERCALSPGRIHERSHVGVARLLSRAGTQQHARSCNRCRVLRPPGILFGGFISLLVGNHTVICRQLRRKRGSDFRLDKINFGERDYRCTLGGARDFNIAGRRESHNPQIAVRLGRVDASPGKDCLGDRTFRQKPFGGRSRGILVNWRRKNIECNNSQHACYHAREIILHHDLPSIRIIH